ncbi:MAG: zinc-binding dehydrogenase [Bacteroidota bacterium]
MKALILKAKDQYPVYEECPDLSPQEGMAIVRVKAAALNHRDVWITKGLYPGIVFPSILGSDGAGIIDDREVVINPSLNWGDNPRYQARDYRILGLPDKGTFADYVQVGEDKLVDKPAHLTFEQAAALPLAGLTAYRALMSRAQVKAGEKVLISGVGGGVALFACQFAIAAGAEVYVSSSSQEKIDRAIEMGAKGGIKYTESDWQKTLAKRSGGIDVIIDSAAGPGFGGFLKCCNFGARIALYGGTRGLIGELNSRVLFWKQISILGTTMGSDAEFVDMVAFVNAHKIVPVVDSVYPIAEGAAAFERMDKGLQFGKIVLSL